MEAASWGGCCIIAQVASNMLSSVRSGAPACHFGYQSSGVPVFRSSGVPRCPCLGSGTLASGLALSNGMRKWLASCICLAARSLQLLELCAAC